MLRTLPRAAFLSSNVVRGYTEQGCETVSRVPTTTERAALRAGVWEADAPPGHIALIVRNSAGERVLRIEISKDYYSHTWVLWLERWLRRWDSKFLRVVR
jgi:hypothetical protein